MKVGRNVEEDVRRAALMRSEIGAECQLMMDANQVWDVATAIAWMKRLSFARPLWIEEPTHCDDVLGHAAIARGLEAEGVGVATGEALSNAVLFKQLLQAKAVRFAQPDTARLNSVPEVLAVLLLCRAKGVPAVFHAGGVGLNEMARHYIMFEEALRGDEEEQPQEPRFRLCEYAQHLAHHFEEECEHKGGRYYPPAQPGFVRMKMSSIREFQFPNGPVWRKRRQSKLSKL